MRVVCVCGMADAGRPDQQLPEMLRCPLESIALRIKSLNLGNIADFLDKAIEPPEKESIDHVVAVLTGLPDLLPPVLRPFIPAFGSPLFGLFGVVPPFVTRARHFDFQQRGYSIFQIFNESQFHFLFVLRLIAPFHLRAFDG
jgi:hypothetical protein